MSVGIAEVDINKDTREHMELRREGHVKKCDLSLFPNEVRERAVQMLSCKAFHSVEPSNARTSMSSQKENESNFKNILHIEGCVSLEMNVSMPNASSDISTTYLFGV